MYVYLFMYYNNQYNDLQKNSAIFITPVLLIKLSLSADVYSHSAHCSFTTQEYYRSVVVLYSMCTMTGRIKHLTLAAP